MTNIEQKALALAREVSPDDKNRVCKEPTVYFALWEALCRAIEQHERFRQDVSDALKGQFIGGIPDKVARFIIAKPDPLFDTLWALGMADDRAGIERLTKGINEELAKRGLEIREKE